MNKSQFDELTKFCSSIEGNVDSARTVTRIEKKLSEMFPQFSTPEFRKCVLTRFDSDNLMAEPDYTPIDTGQFQILQDDEGFYIVEPCGMADIIRGYFYEGGVSEKIASPKAQQILSFLMEDKRCQTGSDC